MDEWLEIVHEAVVIPAVLFILNSVWPVIYHTGEWLLCAFLAIPLNLIEWLHAAVDVFSGVQTITAPSGSATDLVGYFFGQAVVMKVFWGVTLIAATLCLGFSIIAVVRSMGDSSLNRPVGKVMGSTFKAMFTFLMVPFLCIFAINLSGLALRQVSNMIDSAGSTGEKVYVSSALFAAAVTAQAFDPGGADKQQWEYKYISNEFDIVSDDDARKIMGPVLESAELQGIYAAFAQSQEELMAVAEAFVGEAERIISIDLSWDGICTLLRNSNIASPEQNSTFSSGSLTIKYFDESFGNSQTYLELKDAIILNEGLYQQLIHTPNLSDFIAAEVEKIYRGDVESIKNALFYSQNLESFTIYSAGTISREMAENIKAELRPHLYTQAYYLVVGPVNLDKAGDREASYAARDESDAIISKYANMGVSGRVLNAICEILTAEWYLANWDTLFEAGKAYSLKQNASEENAERNARLFANSSTTKSKEKLNENTIILSLLLSDDTVSENESSDMPVGAADLADMNYFEARNYILTHKLFGLIESDGVGDSNINLFTLLTYHFNFYSMFSENYFPLLIASWFYLILMLMIFMIFIRRAFELIVLFVVSPFFVSSIPLDDGAKFKVWREQFISKAVAGFGSIITLKIFILFLPLIWQDSLKLHQGDVINFLLKLLLMVGGIYAAYKSHTMISSIISERGAASERESTVVMQNMMQSAKGLAMAPAGFAKMIATDRLRSHANTVVSMGEKKVAGGIANAFKGKKSSDTGGESQSAALPDPPTYAEALKQLNEADKAKFEAPIKPDAAATRTRSASMPAMPDSRERSSSMPASRPRSASMPETNTFTADFFADTTASAGTASAGTDTASAGTASAGTASAGTGSGTAASTPPPAPQIPRPAPPDEKNKF